MGAKGHCHVIHCTTGRIKVRNPAKRLSFIFSKKAKILYSAALTQSVKNEVFYMSLFSLSFFSPSYSSVPAVHLITTVYTTVVRTRGSVCMREAGGVSNSSIK